MGAQIFFDNIPDGAGDEKVLLDEPEFLARAWDRLSGASLVTFHGKGFDLPVLELRSLKHAVAMPGALAARRDGVAEHLDVKELLTANGAAGAAPSTGSRHTA